LRITLDRSRWGVSVALGRSSIKVTGKRYSFWVRERQEQLEADVPRACFDSTRRSESSGGKCFKAWAAIRNWKFSTQSKGEVLLGPAVLNPCSSKRAFTGVTCRCSGTTDVAPYLLISTTASW
jgi:hypothetical protein